ncbi:hypothetical protein [Halarcobacter sp.]|uniref:hypothetical protein n=1 Tax=Halarcobacter sp. TaxID=2321133 RepID=UPI003A93EAEA
MPQFVGNNISQLISNDNNSLDEAMTITNCSIESEKAQFSDNSLNEEDTKISDELCAELCPPQDDQE